MTVSSNSPTVSDAAASVDRLAALSDGIFAVAMTLLAFNVHLPQPPLTDLELRSQLTRTWPDLIALLLSFSAAAMFWRGNQRLLRLMRQSDRPAIFPSLAFLLSVVFLPISTTLYGTFGATRTVAMIYSGNLAVIGILQFSLWLHTLWQPSVRSGPRLPHYAPSLYASAVFSSAFLISFWKPRLAQYIWFAAFAAPLIARLTANQRAGPGALARSHADGRSRP